MYCVVHLPQFPLQAILRHEPGGWDLPLALVDSTGTPPRVVEATAVAEGAGVERGLTSPQALARCRDVVIRSRSGSAESACTEAVLQCAYAFSPNLEVTGPGLVTLDLRGLSVLRPVGAGVGEVEAALGRWVLRLGEALEGLGLRPQLGLGPTPNVALHAARWAGPARPGAFPVRRVTDAAAFVSTLPVAALQPSSDVEELFRRWGIRTVGEMLALGQADLADRLGLEALALFAAASVSHQRPLRLVPPPENYAEVYAFDPPVETLEPILFLLRRFVDALVLRLEARGLAAGEMILALRLESGASLEKRLRLPQASRQADVLFRTLHTRLETLSAESPVVEVALTVLPASPVQHQFGLFEAVLRDPHQFQETLARLAALVGADRVGSPLREPGHRPDAYRLMPPDFENAPRNGDSGWPAGFGSRPRLLQSTPLRRLRPSPIAEVESGPEGKPVRLRCEVVQGRLTVALGPWRSSGHWWDPTAWSREEWDAGVANQGTVVRLSRESGAWRVDGILD